MAFARRLAIAVFGLQAARLFASRVSGEGAALSSGEGTALALAEGVAMGGATAFNQGTRDKPDFGKLSRKVGDIIENPATMKEQFTSKECLKNSWKVWQIFNPPENCDEAQIVYAALYLFILLLICCCGCCLCCCCCRRRSR